MPQEGFTPPGNEPVGLAWGAGDQGEFFWVADRAAKTICQLREDGTLVSESFLGQDAEIGPITWDDFHDGLWVIDQHDWSVRLLRPGGQPEQYRLPLPPTGLSMPVPVTGLTCDADCRSLWICVEAGHCSYLWQIENPVITVEERGMTQRTWREVSVFPRSLPRGLAWVPAEGSEGGCLWGIAHNGPTAPSRQTVRPVCEIGQDVDLNRLVDGLRILDLAPWRRPRALAVKEGQLWAAFEADPGAGQPALVLPLRSLQDRCSCD